MTTAKLIIDVLLSDIKSNDPKTMLLGGEAYLFIKGQPPIRTTLKKTVHKTPNHFCQDSPLAIPNLEVSHKTKLSVPSKYMKFETTFYFERDETTSIIEDLLLILNSRYKWTNSRWRTNLLLNDIIINTLHPHKDTTLVIKQIYDGTASIGQITSNNPHLSIATDTIINAQLIDHSGKKYDLYDLISARYAGWSDLKIEYI